MSSKFQNRDEFLCNIFDKVAPIYSSTGPKYFEYIGQKLVELSKIEPDTKILDIATGRGASLFPAAEKTGQHGYATGIDFSKAMVVETQKQIESQGYTNIGVLQMDAENLEFDTGTFDYVLCSVSIQFFTKYTDALKEINRVLKSNGKLGLSSWKKKDTPPLLSGIMAKYLKGVSIPHNANRQRGEFGTAESLVNILKDAGFSNLEVIEENKRFYYETEEVWWQEQWSHSGRTTFELIKSLGDEIYKQFETEVLNKLGEIKNSHGIPFDANVLYVLGNK